MRKANFRLPYTQEVYTGQSTYQKSISNLAHPNRLNSGKPEILTNLKNSSIRIGNV